MELHLFTVLLLRGIRTIIVLPAPKKEEKIARTLSCETNGDM
jgi:hypothetical protein